jgi:hypothetical protein
MPSSLVDPHTSSGQRLHAAASSRLDTVRASAPPARDDANSQRRAARPQPFHCELRCHSNSKHLQQIFTGFRALEQRGLIRVSQRLLREPIMQPDRVQHLRDARHAHLRVIVNGTLRLHYDTFDGREVDEEYLAQCDYYFKRSFDEAYLVREGLDTRKIKPLGLYYEVYPDGFETRRIARALALCKGFADVVRKTVKTLPTIQSMQALPDYDAPARILFNVKAFDPHNERNRSAEKIEERVLINEMRAACIRKLRAEFGASFFGGFVPSRYARKHFPNELVPDPSLAAKRNYMKLLQAHPICVATTGLHGSIGGKFAEYVCLSKAILSETLNYRVPGDLREGTHYLEFATADECVEQAHRLVSDRELRGQLMSNNTRYYNAWLRPDMLILNSLLTACEATA